MNLIIYPSELKGLVEAPPSKSITHRAIICASFANGKSTIYHPLISEDTIATIKCLKNLGIDFYFYENKIVVLGKNIVCSNKNFDAKESASTLRMLLPIISSYLDNIKFSGTNRLIERVYTTDLNQLTGLNFSRENNTLKMIGKLNASNYYLSGKITTQLISGMIMALPLLPNQPTLYLKDIELDNPYLALTIDICESFGLEFDLDQSKQSIKLKNSTIFLPTDIAVEGDYSNSAYWLAACYFNHDLRVGELNINSIQGDKAFFDYLKAMKVIYQYNNYEYQYLDGEIHHASIDITKTPDLGPILVSLASLCKETVIISGIEKLNYKESNRNLAMADGINRLGGKVIVEADKIIVQGQEYLNGGCEVDSFNDHRIVMALSILSNRCKNPFMIKNFEAVNKSYPNFFDEFERLGGKVEVIR